MKTLPEKKIFKNFTASATWELFEFSSVPVPHNPEALTIMRCEGINVDVILEKKQKKQN